MKICVVSGGFDPLHNGHIQYINSAKGFGDILIVALNSDSWLINKKGKYFMSFEERMAILENLKAVDRVIGFKDDIEGSCIKALEFVKKSYPKDQIIFCNGGDRNKTNIPELKVKGIDFIFEVGGESKLNSSSDLIKNYFYSSESRVWGKFINLYQDKKNIKVKELIIEPGKGMSFQKHYHRNEIWLVSHGGCYVNFSKGNSAEVIKKELNKFDSFTVKSGEWHQIINPNKFSCHIIEIQFGNKVCEKDIERLHFYEGNNV